MENINFIAEGDIIYWLPYKPSNILSFNYEAAIYIGLVDLNSSCLWLNLDYSSRCLSYIG